MQKSQLINEPSELLVSRKQLSQRWNCCLETIKRREQEGLLKAIRFNQRLLRYRLSDVIAIETIAAGEPARANSRNPVTVA